ncbi:MAG: hypothetical protein HON43_00425 [Alphaproteobacteria bacterium]|jgi:hypothetical protein|nr:hypothetical protein [Alphaproteobacteria bacterium]MBT5389477.1 hypothetical protein [Alphaproteobacteria bacterium]MBT5541193.1 hypothetical protein [Alphaproteobacteria bacterium]
MDIIFRARKILGPFSSFEVLDELPGYLEGKVDPGIIGSFAGIYRNTPGTIEDSVVVGRKGVQVIRKDSSDIVFYEEVKDIKPFLPGEGKLKYECLEVVLKSNEEISIPIRNGDGKLRDAFEFLRFMRRAMSR